MPVETTKSTATRQRILDAAAKAFRAKGFVATRLAEIAGIAGLRAGSIYYHFASKEQILEEVLDIGIRRISESVQAAVGELPDGTSHRRRITVAMTSHLSALLRHGDYTSANIRIFGQIPEEVRERHLEVRHVYEAFWRRLLEEACKAGEIRSDLDLGLARLAILGGLNWSIEWYRPEGATIEAIAGAFADLAFDGFGTDASSPDRD